MKYILLFSLFLLVLVSCESKRTVSENPQHKYLSPPIERLFGNTYFISLESDVPQNYWDGSPVRIFSNQFGESGEIVAKKELGITDNAHQIKLEKDSGNIVLCYTKDKNLEVREFTKGFELSTQIQIELPQNAIAPLILSKEEILIPYHVVEKETDSRALTSIHGKKYLNGKLVWDKKLLDAKSNGSFFNSLTDLYSIDNQSNFIFEGSVTAGENSVLSYEQNTFIIKYDKEGNAIWKFETDSIINLASKLYFDEHHLFAVANSKILDVPILLNIDKEDGTTNTTVLKEITHEKMGYIDNFQIAILGESYMIFGRKSKRYLLNAQIFEDTIFALQLSKTFPPTTEKYIEYLPKNKSKQIWSIKVHQFDNNKVILASGLLSTVQTGENTYSSEKTGEWILHLNQKLEVLQETIIEAKNESTFVKLSNENIYMLSEASTDSLNDNFINKGFDTKTYNSIKAKTWSTNIEVSKVVFDQ